MVAVVFNVKRQELKCLRTAYGYIIYFVTRLHLPQALVVKLCAHITSTLLSSRRNNRHHIFGKERKTVLSAGVEQMLVITLMSAQLAVP